MHIITFHDHHVCCLDSTKNYQTKVLLLHGRWMSAFLKIVHLIASDLAFMCRIKSQLNVHVVHCVICPLPFRCDLPTAIDTVEPPPEATTSGIGIQIYKTMSHQQPAAESSGAANEQVWCRVRALDNNDHHGESVQRKGSYAKYFPIPPSQRYSFYRSYGFAGRGALTSWAHSPVRPPQQVHVSHSVGAETPSCSF